MKKTIQIDYSDWDLDTILVNKLKEMGILEVKPEEGGIAIRKTGTLIIEFIEE